MEDPVAFRIRSRRLKHAERRKLQRLARALGAKGQRAADMPTHMAWVMVRGYGKSADEAEADVLSMLRVSEPGDAVET